MSTTLTFVARHGQTTLNASNCFRGAMNPNLNDKGRRDAHVLANYFEPINLSAIFYSDKRRSTETADIIAGKKPGVYCHGTPSLHAWNVGEFSGQPKNAENKAKLEYYIQNPDIPIPQGESLNTFKARIQPCIMEALNVANDSGAPVLLVVHSSVIHETGAMINKDTTSALVEPGGVAAICTENGQLLAKPILKPDFTRVSGKADTVS